MVSVVLLCEEGERADCSKSGDAWPDLSTNRLDSVSIVRIVIVSDSSFLCPLEDDRHHGCAFLRALCNKRHGL